MTDLHHTEREQKPCHTTTKRAPDTSLWGFMARWANNLTHHPEWRIGQAAYNSLPEGHALVPTTIDPFHIDANLPAFLVWVRKECS